MKKIILSATVAAMALTTTASALEDIKVNGQAKLWYETNNKGDNGMFNKEGSSGEVVFKVGVTGKQGNVGFGATVYQTSTMGLEGNLVSATRDNTTNLTSGEGEMYTGEMYITAPIGAKTLLKVGKQELDTPLAFTERWNATPNTFNAAVAINNSISNLTLIAAYVGQGSNDGSFKSDGEVDHRYLDTSVYAAAALYKADSLAVNVWAYELSSLANAVWADVALKAGPLGLKLYAAQVMPKGQLKALEDTTALAISAGMKAGPVKLFAAASQVSDDAGLPVANTATGFKKTKLPTAGVYTDGVFVAQPDSTAFKLKAATKLGSTGIELQAIDNSNDSNELKETTEIDLILTQKLGDFNFKAILMDRSFDNDALDDSAGGQHVRVIASVNF